MKRGLHADVTTYRYSEILDYHNVDAAENGDENGNHA